MGSITIVQPYISRSDINRSIEEFKQVRLDDSPLLTFTAEVEIRKIDILFIGYLLLFKAECPELTIILEFPHGIETDTKYKLLQSGVYGYLLTGQPVFTIHTDKNPENEKWAFEETFDFTGRRTFPTNYFVLSEKFMLLLISESSTHLFKLLLETPLSQLNGQPLYEPVGGVDWNASNPTLYTNYNNTLIVRAKPQQHERGIINLGRIAFYNCLAQAKVLNFYTDPQFRADRSRKRERIQAGVMGTKQSYEYYALVEPVFNELADKPLIYQFIFSALISSELIPGRTPEDISLANVDKIWHLWQFTENLVKSLYELAKNIRDHVHGGCGIITGSIFNDETELLDNKTLLHTIIRNNTATGNHFKTYLDLHVADLGSKGLIPTFIQRSNDLLEIFRENEAISGLIREDIEKFKNKEIELKHLFDANSTSHLNQQCKRAMAHIGLLTLSKLIETNEGILKVDTQENHETRNTILVPLSEQTVESEIKHGTFFTIILPLHPSKIYKSYLPGSLQQPSEPSPNELKGIENLFDFKYFDLNKDAIPGKIANKTIFGYIFPETSTDDRAQEYQLWKAFDDKLKDWNIDEAVATHCLVHMDLEKLSPSSSTLLRLVGFWEMYYPKVTLLLSNISNSLYEELTHINHALTANNDSLGFWNDHSPLLIYSYVAEKKDGDRFYFTDIFLGKKFYDFNFYNKILQRNHFNSTRLLQRSQKLNPADETFYTINSLAFYKKIVLLPFDLILIAGNGCSLFECNATMLLKNKIDSEKKEKGEDGRKLQLISTLDRIKKFSGYKVALSHYRIGSKLHISDFYYAKRIFQNNFFASRFAYMLSREIINSLNNKNADDLEMIRKQGLSIIGYGLYSELLLSLIEKFVRNSKILPSSAVNHNLIADESEPTLVKSTRVNQHVIIVVPIASTFSTAIKIEEKLLRDKAYDIMTPHYNILHVSGDPDCSEQKTIEEEFGWGLKDPANKIINLKPYFLDRKVIKVQKYFIQLPTTWKKIESCPHCFPVNDKKEEDLLAEKPLFETDRTSVTPSIIFDYPKGSSVTDRQCKLTPEMIRFGQYAASNSHFIYSIDTESFLEENLEGIKTWLGDIGLNREFSKRFSHHNHTLIVSSCHYSNAGFIDLINEELFSSSANIIHYDPENDYIQNFELIYGNEIAMAERIIFVDDTLKSGDTFSRINEFVRFILINRKMEIKGIDACIVLIDKSEPFTQKTIHEKMTGIKKIYGFINLQLFTALSLSNTSTMQLEKERCLKLAADSFLDSLKVHFNKHIQKLKYNRGGNADEEDENILQLRRNNHLLMIEATHLIYQYFTHNHHSLTEQISFREFLDGIHLIKSPLENTPSSRKEILDLLPLEVYLLKALSQYPFTQYEPLRKWVFQWILQLLDRQIDKISADIRKDEDKKDEKPTFTIESFSGLKFMIRRATLMNSNYLISKKFFDFLYKLYSADGLPRLKKELETETKKNEDKKGFFEALNKKKYAEIVSFPIFISAQIKELLSKNQFRSIKLEPLLIVDKKMKHPGHRQIILILRAENSIAFQKFYESISMEKKWKDNYSLKDAERNHKNEIIKIGLPVADTDPIAHELQQSYIQEHQAHRSLAQFMDDTGQGLPWKNLAFKHYLWIRNFIDVDQHVKKVMLSDRAGKLFDMLRQVFESQNLSYTGIFLAVPDGENSSQLAYDKNSKGVAELDSNNWPGTENHYIQRFMNGIKPDEANYNTTMVELRRNQQHDAWVDLYDVQNDNIISDLSYSFLSEGEITNMLLLRLSKRIDDKTEKVIGIIGIYFKSPRSLTEANTVRYLLLLRSPLTEFVERHYHNNEFSDWLNAENTKRLALLSGHGKEMLKALAENTEGKPKKHLAGYREIAWNLEHLQVIILLHDNVRNNEPLEDITKTFNKFYHVEGSKIINKDYFDCVESMAKEMYDLDDIEVSVDCDVRINADDNFSFAFNRSILNLIFFELIVNAKKNRWHFLEDDFFRNYDRNIFHGHVTTIVKDSKRFMQIKLTNIGPQVSKTILSALKSPTRNAKPNDITAGTSLLKTLVRRILKGEIDFDSDPKHAKSGLQEFTVTLTLPEMN